MASAWPLGVVLRRAGPADAAAVRDLTHRAYARWVPALGREPLPMTVDYNRAVVEHSVDMLLDGEGLVALIETAVRTDDLLVVNLAVDPGQQGRGLGDALLAHAERLAARCGRETVRLYTNSLMGGNVGFYAARGYGIEREEPFGAGRRVHMAKAVSLAGSGR